MRTLLGVLALLGALGLVVFGGMLVFVGFREQHSAHPPYEVEFRPGHGECDDGRLYLSTEDGKRLSCVPGGFVAGWGYDGELPGFTAQQTDEVMVLSEELGRDGLSAADQRQIQQRVERLAAKVPPADRPHHPVIWGAHRAWLGVGMVVVAIVPAWMLLRRI